MIGKEEVQQQVPTSNWIWLSKIKQTYSKHKEREENNSDFAKEELSREHKNQKQNGNNGREEDLRLHQGEGPKQQKGFLYRQDQHG